MKKTLWLRPSQFLLRSVLRRTKGFGEGLCFPLKAGILAAIIFFLPSLLKVLPFVEDLGGVVFAQFTQLNKIVASDRAANDYFGRSVSISGNYAIVGAYWEDEDVAGGNNMTKAGSAYIYENIAGTWIQVQKIVASDRAVNDFFGGSVSISGNYAIVGGAYEDEDASGGNTMNLAGSAYIYYYNGANWAQQQKLVASDRAADDLFGISVSISGCVAIAGACQEDEDAAGGNTMNQSGSAYIFGGIPITTVVTTTTTVLCNGQCTGTATATASGGTSPYTYLWNAGGQTTSAATGLCGGTTYSVTVTDASGCSNTNTQTVSVTQPSLLTASAAATAISCSGGIGSAAITAGGGSPSYTYSWNPGGGTSSAATGLIAGNYTVSITDKNGCLSTQTLAITEPAVLTATVNSTPAGCNGNKGSAWVSISGGTAGYTYRWNPVGATAQTVTGLWSGMYACTITDANGCTAQQTVTIASGSIVGIVPSSTVCSGQSVTLTASGGTSYVWSTGNTPPSITLSLTTTSTYSVIATDGSCSDTVYATVTVNSLPAITISGTTTLCAGQTATLSASGGTSYVWIGGSASSIINVSPTANASYTVIVSDGNCTDSASVTITIYSLPVASAAGRTICAGNIATLTASGGGTYSWNTSATTAAINISPPINTTYSVVVSNGNCADTAVAVVTVNPLPVAAIQTSNTTIIAGSSAALGVSGGVSYLWSNSSTESIITVTPALTTQYCVTVTDINGCTDDTCVTVTVEPIDCPSADGLYLPNVFSPNNDGENDMLQVYFGNYLCIKTFQLVIYNRWGENVFETTNPSSDGWDGKYRENPMHTQSLAYYLQATMMDGTEINRQGNISLIR